MLLRNSCRPATVAAACLAMAAPVLAQQTRARAATSLEHVKPVLSVDRDTCLVRASEALRQAGYSDVRRGGDTVSGEGEPAVRIDCHSLSASRTLATVMVAGVDASTVQRVRSVIVALLGAGGADFQGVFGGTGGTGSRPGTTTDRGPGGSTTATTTPPWPNTTATPGPSAVPVRATPPAPTTLAGRWQWTADCAGNRFQGQWTIEPGSRDNEYAGTFGNTNQYDVGNLTFVVNDNRMRGTRTFEAGRRQRRQDWTGVLSRSSGGVISGDIVEGDRHVCRFTALPLSGGTGGNAPSPASRLPGVTSTPSVTPPPFTPVQPVGGTGGRYLLVPRRAISGYNIQTLRNVSVAQCEAACDRRSDCLTFDYTRGGTTCYLQNKADGTVASNSYDHYVKPGVARPASSGAGVGGTGEPGTTALKLPPDTPFRQLPPPSAAGMGDWKVDYGKYEAVGGVINASPAGDGKTSYYIAPASMLGDWRRFGALVFDKKSWGGTYYGPDSYAAYGDVVIKRENKSARYDIDADHSGNWRTYRIALSDRGWKFSGGAGSLADIVPNVTELKIRAEYGGGTDYSALRRVKFEGGGTTPTANAGSGAGSGYRYIAHTAISGHNKEILRNVSVDDCRTACNERPWCKSFDYSRPDQHNSLHCHLQEVNSADVPQSSFITNSLGRSYDYYEKIGGGSARSSDPGQPPVTQPPVTQPVAPQTAATQPTAAPPAASTGGSSAWPDNPNWQVPEPGPNETLIVFGSPDVPLGPMPLPPLGAERKKRGQFLGFAGSGEYLAGRPAPQAVRGAINAIHTRFEPFRPGDPCAGNLIIELDVEHKGENSTYWDVDLYVSGRVSKINSWDGIVWDEKPIRLGGGFGWKHTIPFPSVQPVKIRAELYRYNKELRKDQLMHWAEATASRPVANLRHHAYFYAGPPDDFGNIPIKKIGIQIVNTGNAPTGGGVFFTADIYYKEGRNLRAYNGGIARAYKYFNGSFPQLGPGQSEYFTDDDSRWRSSVSTGRDWNSATARVNDSGCQDADIRDNHAFAGAPGGSVRLNTPTGP